MCLFLRFLRRLEKSIKTRERIVSISDSCAEENTDDVDSPQATSPLLQPQSPNRSKTSICRQKRVAGSSYGKTAMSLKNDKNWKNAEQNLMTCEDLNSD